MSRSSELPASLISSWLNTWDWRNRSEATPPAACTPKYHHQLNLPRWGIVALCEQNNSYAWVQEHRLLRLTKYWLSGDATCTIQSEAFSGSPMFMRAEPRRNWREWQFQSHHVDSRRTYSWICINWQAESKMQHLWPPLFFVYFFFTTTWVLY